MYFLSVFFFYNSYIFIHLFTLNYALPSLLCSQLERRKKPSRDKKENQKQWRKRRGEWRTTLPIAGSWVLLKTGHLELVGGGVLSNRSKCVLWRWNEESRVRVKLQGTMPLPQSQAACLSHPPLLTMPTLRVWGSLEKALANIATSAQVRTDSFWENLKGANQSISIRVDSLSLSLSLSLYISPSLSHI